MKPARTPSRTPARTTVRLVGIARRHQGSHDSFCAYYSAAMLLCALRPELDDDFEAPRVEQDPLFANLPRRGRSVADVAASWLTSGVALPSLARALDGACARGPVRTRFRFRRARADAATLAWLQAQVDDGLPCLVGWEGAQLGDHTSLVIGYDRFAADDNCWLRVLDPIRVQETIEWRQLARLTTAKLEIIACRAHDGLRPDKLIVTRDRHGKLVGNEAQRWDPRAQGWTRLY